MAAGDGELASLKRELARLRRETEVLAGIVGAARDACWCIDYEEPVDLTAPEDETVRQFFENECHWRYCNQAMADLYRLPEGSDFNRENVRVAFPRNPANETFARRLIQAGFHLDGARSRDRRYDGQEFDVANDVRGTIRDGRLLRMWGTVRDLSPLARREEALRQEAAAVRRVLSAIPDPILVLDREGRVAGANPAVGWSLGWTVEELLGRRGEELLRPPGRVAELLGAAEAAVPRRADAAVLTRGGALLLCELCYTATEETEGGGEVVVTLRVAAAAEAGGERRRAR